MTNTKSAIETSNTRQPTSRYRGDELQLGHDLIEYAKQYAREKPEAAALWCLGIGFILGWKLKPW
jgi:hypothetical protein